MAFPPAFDAAWDETFPPDSQQANLLGQDIRNFKRDIRERVALLSGTLANQPSNMDAVFGGANYGTLFFATDTGDIFQWSGAAWVNIRVGRISSLGTVQMSGARVASLYLNNTGAAGNNDFLDSATGLAYVVPAGKIGLVGLASVYNGNAGASTDYVAVKVGGIYYQVSSSSLINSGANSTFIVGPFMLNAGEGLAINGGQANQNAFIRCLEVDLATSNIKQARILGLANGNQTIYTCPAGKTAAILSSPSGAVDGNTGVVVVVNGTGGPLNYQLNVVKNTGVVSTSNLINITNNLGSVTRAGLVCNAALAPGDFININSSAGTAGQNAWVLILEF